MSEAETLGAWLDAQLDGVDQHLADRIIAALPDGWRARTIGEAPEVLAEAAANRLRALLEDGCETRWAAPALLAADALATLACASLAIAGGEIAQRAESMAEMLASTLVAPDAAA